VVDADNRPIGVVSEADLLPKAEHLVPLPRQPWDRPRGGRDRARLEAAVAADMMSSPVVTVTPQATIAMAAHRMREASVKRLVVVDEHGRVAGIVSRADLLRVFVRDDDEIRRDVVDGVILRWLWIDPVTVGVSVEDGVVTLTGTVERRSDAELLVELAGGVEGVSSISSTLEYEFDDRKTEPTSEARLR
jgi:CBS domain-containing protein